MLGRIASLRASGEFASPRAAGADAQSAAGEGLSREIARLPLSLTLSPLSRGEGI